MSYPQLKQYDVLDDLYDWEVYKKVWKLQPKIWPQFLCMKMKTYLLWRKTVRYRCLKGTPLPVDLLYLHLQP